MGQYLLMNWAVREREIYSFVSLTYTEIIQQLEEQLCPRRGDGGWRAPGDVGSSLHDLWEAEVFIFTFAKKLRFSG